MISNEKTCLDCEKTKPRTDFHAAGRGVQGCCKTCQLERKARWRRENPEAFRLQWMKGHIKREYGLTWDDYVARYDKQGGKCVLCPRQFDLLAKGGLVVDHDHETGRVRGLLCRTCNSALGALGDGLEGLQRAVRYVQGD